MTRAPTLFALLVLRDLRLAIRSGADSATAVLFFVVTVAMVPLAVGPDADLLSRLAGGMVSVGALLAALLSLDRLFQVDHEDGSLDQLALGPLPLEAVVLAKAAAHWLTTGLPLVVAAPLLALMLQMPAAGHGALAATMAIGTPAISLTGALGASLLVGARRGGVLIAVIVLPLFVPLMIFAVGGIQAGINDTPLRPHLLLLAGTLALAATVAPVAGAAALRGALR